MASIREAQRLTDDCKLVFAWVKVTKDDGLYLRVTKRDVISWLNEQAQFPVNFEIEYNFVLRDGGDLYIN